MTNSIHFEGRDFYLSVGGMDPDMVEHLMSLGGSGQQEENAEAFLATYTVTGNPKDCRAYLRAYGAWDGCELSDHRQNLLRLVWLAGCMISEYDSDEDPGGYGPEAYFSAY